MMHFYNAEEGSLNKIRIFGRDKFKEFAGFAQQYLFYYARENKIRGLLKESLEVDDVVYYNNDLYVVSSICEDLCTIINESKEIKNVPMNKCLFFDDNL